MQAAKTYVVPARSYEQVIDSSQETASDGIARECR